MAKPIFRWTGSKRWLVPIIVPYIQCQFKSYYEPFVGGGAIFFALAPNQGLVSDTNFDLTVCYSTLKDNPSKVISILDKLPVGKSHYYRIRDEWEPETNFDKAAKFLYLIRYSWNGIYRVNRNGRFNVPYSYRERKTNLTMHDIEPACEILRRVEISCQDFKYSISQSGKGDLVFADPPYFSDTRQPFRRYTPKYFEKADQEALASALLQASSRGASWILTNGSMTHIREYFPQFDTYEILRQSSIAADPSSRGRLTEYVVISNSSELNPLRNHLEASYPKVSAT